MLVGLATLFCLISRVYRSELHAAITFHLHHHFFINNTMLYHILRVHTSYFCVIRVKENETLSKML